MDNEANKFVLLEGFNHEYFKEGMLVIVRPKPGEILTINPHRSSKRASFSIGDDQFMVGCIYTLSETGMDICVPSSNDEFIFTIKASNNDTFTIDRLEDMVILSKSEYKKLKGVI